MHGISEYETEPPSSDLVTHTCSLLHTASWLYANLSSQRAVQGGDVKDSEVMVVAPIFL